MSNMNKTIFQLELKLDDYWYDGLDLEETVRVACTDTIKRFVKEKMIEILEKENGIELAMQQLLDAGLLEEVGDKK